LPAEGTCLLFVGNDYRKKGLQALLQAMAQLPDGVVLAVVGNPAHIAEFRALAETLKLGDGCFSWARSRTSARPTRPRTSWCIPPSRTRLRWWCWRPWPTACRWWSAGRSIAVLPGCCAQGVNALMLDDPRDAGELARVLGDLLGQAGAAGNAVRGRCGLCRALPVAGNRAAAGSRQRALYRFCSRRGEGREFL
jgi:hypothetical protein